MNDLKPNNCNVNFGCTNPKKCVHYKRVKQQPKPCRTCSLRGQCDIMMYTDYCYKINLWNANKSLCRHNQGIRGECYNTIAQVQAITKYLKSIGVSVHYGDGCKCSAECSEKNGIECGAVMNIENLAKNQKNLDPEFAKIVAENFFDLVAD